MLSDKEFLKEAVHEVYRKGLLEEDKELQLKAKEVVKNNFEEEELAYFEETLKDLDRRFKSVEYECFVDGAVEHQTSEPKASVGFVIYTNNEIFYKHKYSIPTEYTINGESIKTSSHIAEYQSLLILLRVLQNKILYPERAKITINTDSEVLKGQFYLEYRVTNVVQKSLRDEIMKLTKSFKQVDINWVSRDSNTVADRLATEKLTEDSISL